MQRELVLLCNGRSLIQGQLMTRIGYQHLNLVTSGESEGRLGRSGYSNLYTLKKKTHKMVREMMEKLKVSKRNYKGGTKWAGKKRGDCVSCDCHVRPEEIA